MTKKYKLTGNPCGHCGEPLSHGNISGYHRMKPECYAVAQAEYYRAHRDELLTSNAERWARTKDEVNASRREKYRKDKGK